MKQINLLKKKKQGLAKVTLLNETLVPELLRNNTEGKISEIKPTQGTRITILTLKSALQGLLLALA